MCLRGTRLGLAPGCRADVEAGVTGLTAPKSPQQRLSELRAEMWQQLTKTGTCLINNEAIVECMSECIQFISIHNRVFRMKYGYDDV